MDSRKKKQVNSQKGKKVQNKLTEKRKKGLGGAANIMVLLNEGPPLIDEELCKKAGVTVGHFRYKLSKRLIAEERIKKLSDERWAHWDYKEKQKYGESEILRLIAILDNDKMLHKTRLSAGIKLWNCCSSESEIVGGKNELRHFLISILDNFESINFESDRGIVFTQTKNSLNDYLAFQLQGEYDIKWAKETCYPRLENLFENSSNIEGKDCILRILSQIYRTSELDIEQRKLTRLLRKKFFDPKEDGSIAISCWRIFLGQAGDELKEPYKDVAFRLAMSWEKFCSLVGLVNGESFIDESEQTKALPREILFDELKEILEDTAYNMSPDEKEILEKRGLEAMEKYYNF